MDLHTLMKAPIQLADRPENPDLYWDLSALRNKKKAVSFFQNVSTGFCVYSPSVAKLYSNFEVILSNMDRSGLIVLPNPYAFHDTFNRVCDTSIKKTGISLFPGEAINRDGFIVSIPIGKQRRNHHLELEAAVGFLNRLYQKRYGTPFLPVLLNGDLKEFKSNTPYLHLHRFDPTKLTEFSEFERNDICSTILDRFSDIVALAI